jgi:light-regulated signal transduction histidine kinase (bacteriophytochrome)
MQDTPSRQTYLTILPFFANFILKNCLDEYASESLRAQAAPMKSSPEQPGSEFQLKEIRNHLEKLAAGVKLESWTNELQDEDVTIGDAVSQIHIRKSTLLQFIPRYTTDPLKIIELARELDEWQLDQTVQAIKLFAELSHERAVRLQESNDSLRDFAFVASHDLKEPLRKISTLGDRLQAERNGLTPEGKVYLDKMINASIRMQKMVDDLLSLSQISADRRFEKVSLNALMADVLQTFEPRIESMSATIHAERLPDAEVVPSQFRQLFQNLVGNALKFASKDRPPVLRITCSTVTKEAVGNENVRDAASYLKILFSDNGIGFDNNFADKIFNVFQRLNAKSEYDGAGIGLAICRRIVENHGGTIRASCTPGKGSEFTVVIPMTL